MLSCWAEETSFKPENITDLNLNTLCENYNKCINRAVGIIIILVKDMPCTIEQSLTVGVGNDFYVFLW